MKVKIDTKEKFHVITPEEPVLSANMTEEMEKKLLSYLESDPRNVILKMNEVSQVEKPVAETIVSLQQTFYDSQASFVICEMKKQVEEYFEQLELLDILNFTPTESEAWDIVQMEEIERELLG